MPKRKSNRPYKRGEAHRDARLFIIVTEGEREDRYFGWFDQKSQRIRVQLVPREGNASAPKHFLTRLQKFLDDNGSQIGDSIWFVLDIDAWTRESIDELIGFCQQTPNWHITISNPCFEVWLNMHAGPLQDNGEDCASLKALLNNRIRGGFHPNTICPMIDDAIEHAKGSDMHPTQDYPAQLQTKVYRLAVAMIEVLGRNWKK